MPWFRGGFNHPDRVMTIERLRHRLHGEGSVALGRMVAPMPNRISMEPGVRARLAAALRVVVAALRVVAVTEPRDVGNSPGYRCRITLRNRGRSLCGSRRWQGNRVAAHHRFPGHGGSRRNPGFGSQRAVSTTIPPRSAHVGGRVSRGGPMWRATTSRPSTPRHA
jgi:hypothetical protein